MTVPPELLSTIADYRSRGYRCSTPEAEPESQEYGAYTFSLNDQSVVFRIAKTTPTKIGQFVTLWQRSPGPGQPIRPFDVSDGVDLFVVSVGDSVNSGQFVFPQEALIKRGVVSQGKLGGKRAFRIYPPWTAPTSRQAQATQRWQSEFFDSPATAPGEPPSGNGFEAGQP
ncbi:MepB family protein [Arthrobacter sp. R1-13]